MLTWVLITALAGVPAGVRPVLAPPDAQQQYVGWASTTDRPGRTLPCRDLVAGSLLVCFRLRQDKRRRWVDSSDLAAWDVTPDQLAVEISRRAADHVGKGGRWVQVDGMEARYWLDASGTGWEAGVFLQPERAREALGLSSLYAGAPNVGVTIAWGGGEVELDRVMAIGTREMFSQQAQPVSPGAYRWNGRRWLLWAEAVPAAKPE